MLTYSAFRVILIFSAAITLWLLTVAWRRRVSAGAPATWLAVTMIAVTCYSLGYFLEISSTTLPSVLRALQIEHLGIDFLPPAWLMFALAITGRDARLTPRRIAALFIVPAITYGALSTNNWHGMYYEHPALTMIGSFPSFTFTPGPLYKLNAMYIILCMIISTALYAMMVLQSAPAFRLQAIIFLVSSLLPGLTMVLYLFGQTAYHLDYTPIALSLSGLAGALGVIEFRILDVVPLARDVIFQGLQDGMLVLDARNRILDFNSALQAMLPELGATAVGRPAEQVLATRPDLVALIQAGSPEALEWQIPVNGETRAYQIRLSPLPTRDNRPTGKTVAFHDYTRLKLAMEQLRTLATHDDLTGLYNRRYFGELANREIDRARRYGRTIALVSFDVDHFKEINDSYGHAAGDLVLQQVTEACRAITRSTDLVGRSGGDEFVLLLPETGERAAHLFVERIRTAVAGLSVEYHGQSIPVTCSFGIATVTPRADLPLEVLLSAADQALYAAKARGRNCICERSLTSTGPPRRPAQL